MRTVEVHVPIFKPGDDLRRHLDASSPSGAFEAYAAQLRAAEEAMMEVAGVLMTHPSGRSATIDADNHYIAISSNRGTLIDALLEIACVEETVEESA